MPNPKHQRIVSKGKAIFNDNKPYEKIIHPNLMQPCHWRSKKKEQGIKVFTLPLIYTEKDSVVVEAKSLGEAIQWYDKEYRSHFQNEDENSFWCYSCSHRSSLKIDYEGLELNYGDTVKTLLNQPKQRVRKKRNHGSLDDFMS